MHPTHFSVKNTKQMGAGLVISSCFLREGIPLGVFADALVILGGLVQLAGTQGVQILVNLHLVLSGREIGRAHV